MNTYMYVICVGIRRKNGCSKLLFASKKIVVADKTKYIQKKKKKREEGKSVFSFMGVP